MQALASSKASTSHSWVFFPAMYMARFQNIYLRDILVKEAFHIMNKNAKHNETEKALLQCKVRLGGIYCVACQQSKDYALF